MSEEKNQQNCWDFIKCSNEKKIKCPAYLKKKGRECWMVASSTCEFATSKQCWNCPWFKNLYPDFGKSKK